ncbi:MAG: NAD+ synthase [Bifidobacteriaceae bacterium]|jgi:NAD+ synthase (glutamine-hydrolysing)|nr:NAD+ synthase [Bifidobacteriaceae bacterium]
MPVRVALVQINPRVGDLVGNATLIAQAADDAARLGANLIVLPEMALTGYPIEDLALRRSFQRAAGEALANLAQELATRGAGGSAVIVGGLGTSTGGAPTNIAAVLRHGTLEAVYVKHRLPTYGVFDEDRLFEPGTDPVTIEVEGARVGAAICEDIWIDGPAGPVGQLRARGGVDLLAVLNGSPFELGKERMRERFAARAAAALEAPVVYVNLVGGQDDLVFDGGSFAVSREGHLVAEAGRFHSQTLLWDGSGAGGRPAPMDGDEQLYRALVLGTRDYARKNGFTSAILGLSGGIDSALVAAIATDALGRGNVVGVSMPSVYSSAHSRDDAADLAARCGIDYRIHPIAPMVEAYDAALRLTGVAAENIQARVRGQILMGISNMEGHLVLATGNKSELATGYSTIYGDAVGGFAPLKDLVKTRVWALARWRDARAAEDGEVEPIPVSSILKEPSAELRPGQLDRQSLPDYAVLDEVLDQYIEHACSRQDLLAAGYPADAVDLALRATDRAEWKRRQYPPGPKVTALAFGRDRRLPITNAWTEP